MDEIKRLREKREIEATLKQLSQKMQTVLQNLGQPIVAQASGDFFSREFDTDAWMLPEERERDGSLPTMHEEDIGHPIGQHYDTLRSGTNMEIQYMTHERELKATFDGFTVYREVEGRLEAYVPSERWEGVLESHYRMAKDAEESKRKKEKSEKKERSEGMAKRIIQKLRDTWGNF